MRAQQQTTAAATTTTTTTSADASKKKFGKNLSKLVKPTAPPIVDRSLGSSRNGLLLLSKNKNGVSSNSSGGNTTPAAAATSSTSNSGGMLSKSTFASNIASVPTVTTATSTTASSTAKSPSSYDALLSAVKGEVSSTLSSLPDAWGVSSATTTTTTAATSMPVLKEVQIKGGVGISSSEILDGSVAPAAVGVEGRGGKNERETAGELKTTANTTPPTSSTITPEVDVPVASSSTTAAACPNWDEYGGRGDSSNSRHRGLVLVESGIGSNSTIAATKMTEESQSLVMSRLARERAEKKREEENARLAQQQQKAAMRLRELDEKKIATTPPRRGWDLSKKELWEPPPPLPTLGQQQQQQQHHVRTRSNSAGDRSGSEGGVGASLSPTGGGGGSPFMSPAYSGPLIHLSSYEDRDRGEQRSSNSAPRMLFDPKSGSLVAVKSREEAAAAAAASSKKKNIKKTRSKEPFNTNRDSPSDVAKIARNNKSKKERGNSPSTAGESSPAVNAVNATNKTSSSKPSRKFPRTCGVLYKRDDKGNCYCADGCDGDLGYGAHSVPGGRAKNPDAYALFLKQHEHQLYSKNGAVDYDEDALHFDMYDDVNYDGNDGDVALYTGFNPAEEEELLPEPIEYVRADDKLELVTGVDDSPSLKPTAKEWAPSQAALAAARAAAERPRSNVDSSDEDEGFEEDEDDDGPLGLGFDPTLDMDFVMQSPSHDDDVKHLDSFAISALTLEPSAFSVTENSGPRHIFAFGTSGTWSVTHPSSTASGSDWKVTDIADVAGLFGANAIRVSNDDAAASSTAASFLNIPAASSWVSPTLGGLTNREASTSTTVTGD